MHADLLLQARSLARLDAKRPKQVNLRRAVSQAYYGIVHFLVDDACQLIIGGQHAQKEYRHVLGRSFEHSTIKEACTTFAGGQLKASVPKGLPTGFVVPPEVQGDLAALPVSNEKNSSSLAASPGRRWQSDDRAMPL